MKQTYRDLLKHGLVYAIAPLLVRVASLCVLPVYTAHLTPADYGCIAVLDLTTTLLGILIGSGIAAAVVRYHVESLEEAERDRVWWTGLTFVAAAATAITLPMWFARDLLAYVTLGPDLKDGPYYFALVLPTLWLMVVGGVTEAYPRAYKWSGLSLSLGVIKLCVHLALAVYFLVALEMGAAGILLGNLLGSCFGVSLQLILFVFTRGRYRLDLRLLGGLWRFGAPLVLTALLARAMHDADRYLLRAFADMEVVGVYSLAYQMAYAVAFMCLAPFTAIWGVVLYEIAAQPEPNRAYATVFEYFTCGFMFVMLGVSLFIHPLLQLLAGPAYQGAASLVPVICLGYVFYSLDEHFKVPALVAKRTLNMVPVYVVAASANVLLNLALIPALGAAGAAWASVLTFLAFCCVGLYRYRKIAQYHYPWGRCTLVLVGMIATYISHQLLGNWLSEVALNLVATAALVAWGLFLAVRLKLVGVASALLRPARLTALHHPAVLSTTSNT